MRSFERCLPTQHWHVFRHFPNADFFVSTIEDADSHKAELLRVKYPNARVEIEAVKEQPDCVAEMREKGVDLPKEWSQGKPYTHEPYPISVHPQAVLRQLWQLQKCWELMMRTSLSPLADSQASAPYDVVIRCRPDLWFHSFKMPDWGTRHHQQGGESFAIPNDGPYQRDAFTPWWGSFGGVNDRFALLGMDAARRYFQAYNWIPDLMKDGCPLHPESLIAAQLEEEGVLYAKPLFAEFSTLRSNGEMRPPEITTVDLARLHA